MAGERQHDLRPRFLQQRALRGGHRHTRRCTNDGSTEDDNGSRRDNIGADVENVTGGNGNDSITGSSLGNVLTGGLGADSLFGLDGNDSLMARDGVADTTIDCGTGSDSAQINAGDPAPIGCESVTSG